MAQQVLPVYPRNIHFLVIILKASRNVHFCGSHVAIVMSNHNLKEAILDPPSRILKSY